MRIKYRWLILGVIGGFIVGWILGWGIAVKAIADVAEQFIDIDYTKVVEALTRYNNNLG